jgi:hypothetical protein
VQQTAWIFMKCIVSAKVRDTYVTVYNHRPNFNEIYDSSCRHQVNALLIFQLFQGSVGVCERTPPFLGKIIEIDRENPLPIKNH